MSRGGGFKSSGASGRNKRIAEGLQKDIAAEKNFSSDTTKELNELLGKGELVNTGRLLERARKGEEPVFKFRQRRKEKINLLQDRPGRSQTLLTS